MKGEQTMAIKLKKKFTFLSDSKLHELVFIIHTKILMTTVSSPQLLSDDFNKTCHQLISQVDSEKWEHLGNPCLYFARRFRKGSFISHCVY